MKIAIIANGKFKKDTFKKADILICADGGAEHARKFSLQPDYLIGDFDSVSAETLKFFEQQGPRIIHDQDQDSTDLQKTLRLAEQLGATQIEIYGAVGEELDHTLGNLLCLGQVPSEIEVELLSAKEKIYRVCDALKLDLEPATLVSVIALTQVKGLSYKGLKWLVEDLDVSQNWLGTRNRSTGPVEISLREGQVLVIVREKGLESEGIGFPTI